MRYCRSWNDRMTLITQVMPNFNSCRDKQTSMLTTCTSITVWQQSWIPTSMGMLQNHDLISMNTCQYLWRSIWLTRNVVHVSISPVSQCVLCYRTDALFVPGVDCERGRTDCPRDIETRATAPLCYVVGYSQGGWHWICHQTLWQ